MYKPPKEVLLRRQERRDEMARLIRDKSPEATERYRQLFEEEMAEEVELNKRSEAGQRLRQQVYEQQFQSQQQTMEQLSTGQLSKNRYNFRNSNVYRKSQVLYDLTVHFCSRFIVDYHDRTKDQMVQAARSGKQNFIEGWEDGASDTKVMLNLFAIGKGSLQELREDYEDYLRTHALELWGAGHPRMNALNHFCRERNDTQEYQDLWPKMSDEELANMALTLLHQTDRMLESFIRKQEQEVLQGRDASSIRQEYWETLRRVRRGY